MPRRRICRWLAATALSGICAAALSGSADPPPPSSFYVVSVGFSDALPGWHRAVLEVRSEGSDVLVQYIRVVPANTWCTQRTRILTAATRLPNTSLSVLTHGANLCAINLPSLTRTLRAFPQTQAMIVFAGDTFAIVSQCGSQSNVIPLPGDWTINIERLKRKRPEIAALWTLEKSIGTRAFGVFPEIDVVPAGIASRLQPAGPAILAELQSGRFDLGLAPRSFKDDVAALLADPDSPEFTVKLAHADRFHFDRYIEPPYSSLAKQARITGAVELEITSNPATGEVERVAVISGHPLLATFARDTAAQWRFHPGEDRTTRITVEFASHCP